eukprot:CAMPEP_0205898278 /NCGR_PEP_ID=MMETSP1083-20121108/25964_1 /ASSEMBLY_ACC=CAM_ASM_000430 /TAXON_ID=97485 /ORGANISM="Prymnesium parvum, Strain Texoma1" /LENGTH=92 /DNA_ID=CAMNT_0053263531 /DNA_START=18 /DNA_END=293 /DNA_ORIENTATION=-
MSIARAARAREHAHVFASPCTTAQEAGQTDDTCDRAIAPATAAHEEDVVRWQARLRPDRSSWLNRVHIDDDAPTERVEKISKRMTKFITGNR